MDFKTNIMEGKRMAFVNKEMALQVWLLILSVVIFPTLAWCSVKVIEVDKELVEVRVTVEKLDKECALYRATLSRMDRNIVRLGTKLGVRLEVDE